MLVLTRKIDEQILIGDNIKITLVRVHGNSVRIGIDAPREVRVLRGELTSVDSNTSDDSQFELGDREQVFAHPQGKIISQRVKLPADPSRDSTGQTRDPIPQAAKPSTFVGRVRRATDGDSGRAPLAGFVSAT
jgi:carbon storage regulator CsrA